MFDVHPKVLELVNALASAFPGVATSARLAIGRGRSDFLEEPLPLDGPPREERRRPIFPQAMSPEEQLNKLAEIVDAQILEPTQMLKELPELAFELNEESAAPRVLLGAYDGVLDERLLSLTPEGATALEKFEATFTENIAELRRALASGSQPRGPGFAE